MGRIIEHIILWDLKVFLSNALYLMLGDGIGREKFSDFFMFESYAKYHKEQKKKKISCEL